MNRSAISGPVVILHRIHSIMRIRVWVCPRIHTLSIAVRRHSDRRRFPERLIVEKAVIYPPGARVKGPCTGVGGHNGKPGLPESILRHSSLSLADESLRDTAAPVLRGNVNLLDFVLHDHDESGDQSIDDSDGRVANPLRSTSLKRLSGPRSHQFGPDAAEVAITPAGMPDRGDLRGVTRSSGTY
jgi:hypothetical protein